MALVMVWLRDGRVLAAPSGGHGLDIEPIGVADASADAVGVVVRAALAASAAHPADTPAPPKGWKSPVLKAAGVRSYKKLYAGASLCLVIEDEDGVTIERWQPAADFRGFDRGESPAIPVTEREGLGRLVLEALDAG